MSPSCQSLLSAGPNHTLLNREFAERFKYVVISSSLLSPSLSTPATATRRSWPPSYPPHPFQLSDQQSSVRSSSLSRHRFAAHSRSPSNSSTSHIPSSGLQSIQSGLDTSPSVLLAAIAVVALLCGWSALAVLLGTVSFVVRGQGLEGLGHETSASKTDVVEPVSFVLRILSITTVCALLYVAAVIRRFGIRCRSP